MGSRTADRAWIYCCDALPAEDGYYEVAWVHWVADHRLSIEPSCGFSGGKWETTAPTSPYAWRRRPDRTPPPLRPADRDHLLAAGVPAEWLTKED
jgi:hypothetical protein